MNRGFKMAFASEVSLHACEEDEFSYRVNEMNLGSSGRFSPSKKESYWRIIHAASLLQNWDSACHIINKHCKLYTNLKKQIFELNKKENK